MIVAKLFVVLPFFPIAFGDPNDWISINYVTTKAQYTGRVSSTSDAEATIVRLADRSASEGPWSIANSQGILPPNGTSHDYLSWAPYHWPDCNWCPPGRTHLAHTIDDPNNYTDNRSSGSSSSTDMSFSTYSPDDPYQYFALSPKSSPKVQARQVEVHTSLPPLQSIVPPSIFPLSPPNPVKTPPPDSSTTRGPAQAAAKTVKSSCTPSPTKAIAPSATWTTCSYVVRDGQVNPDVRTLHGPGAINSASQYLLYIALAYALQKQRSQSRNFASFVETFFVKDATKVNPNVNFGQIVRGPGEAGSTGTFTGILDMRGLVKIFNAVMIMKATKSPDWTPDLENAMESWARQYRDWLVTSKIGQTTASRPNNHVSFFVSQMTATSMLMGDIAGAVDVLQRYFMKQFLDQIAASGDQPFEAVRTRPFHYRLFNIEAMITNAKLGDQLGLDFWTAKSKYGATIQTAIDFAMTRDPKGEDVSQIFPHVAAVAAAYGDPTGKYMAFLKQHDPTYQSKTYWFYDQSTALANAPTSRSKRSVTWSREDTAAPPTAPPKNANPTVPHFECPAVFDNMVQVEIDNGIYVTCDQLRPFYLDSQADL